MRPWVRSHYKRTADYRISQEEEVIVRIILWGNSILGIKYLDKSHWSVKPRSHLGRGCCHFPNLTHFLADASRETSEQSHLELCSKRVGLWCRTVTLVPAVWAKCSFQHDAFLSLPSKINTRLSLVTSCHKDSQGLTRSYSSPKVFRQLTVV